MAERHHPSVSLLSPGHEKKQSASEKEGAPSPREKLENIKTMSGLPMRRSSTMKSMTHVEEKQRLLFTKELQSNLLKRQQKIETEGDIAASLEKKKKEVPETPKEQPTTPVSRRINIVKEIFETETTYMDYLKVIIISFLTPMEKLFKDKPEKLQEISSVLFQNIISIQNLHWVWFSSSEYVKILPKSFVFFMINY